MSIKTSDLLKLKEHIAALRKNEASCQSPEILDYAQRYMKHANGLMSDNVRKNDNASLTFANQLIATLAEVVMQPVAPNSLLSIVQNEPSVLGHPLQQVRYYKQMSQGIAKPTKLSGNDVPIVSLARSEVSHENVSYALGAKWSVRDVELSILLGTNLSADMLNDVRRGLEGKLNEVLAFGDADSGIPSGLLNQTVGTSDGMIRETVATSASWTASTAADMHADLNKLYAEFRQYSADAQPKLLLLPTGAAAKIRMAKLSENGETVAQMFERTSGVQIVGIDECKNVTSNGSYDSRGLLGTFDLADVSHLLTKNMEMLAPQFEGFDTKVYASVSTAGCAIKKPIHFRYLTYLPDEA
jgi:hypothetical protein